VSLYYEDFELQTPLYRAPEVRHCLWTLNHPDSPLIIFVKLLFQYSNFMVILFAQAI
jgi:hypothetical protein